MTTTSNETGFRLPVGVAPSLRIRTATFGVDTRLGWVAFDDPDLDWGDDSVECIRPMISAIADHSDFCACHEGTWRTSKWAYRFRPDEVTDDMVLL